MIELSGVEVKEVFNAICIGLSLFNICLAISEQFKNRHDRATYFLAWAIFMRLLANQ